MASLDGAPIVFVFLSLVGLLVLSPAVSRSLWEGVAWMFGGLAGAISGSILFLMLGGSDHAPRVMIGVPFLMAAAGGWLSLRLRRSN